MLRPVLLVLSFILIAQAARSQNTEYSTVDSIIVQQNNMSGGGFQSDVTITSDGLTVYSSADVSGIFKSTDGGLLFNNVNQGLKSPKVASVAITEDNHQILYAGTGDKGGSGGLFRSINGGETWVITNAGDSAQFAGNHSSTFDSLPEGHPRSNGDLIIIDKGNQADLFTDDIIVAGTYKDGVRIFTQGGDIEASAVNTSGYVRSVAYHDSIPHVAFGAIYFSDVSQNGIYHIDYADPSAPISTLVYQTPEPEGIAVLGSGMVYAAIGNNGIVAFNGTSWNLVNTGLSVGHPYRRWTAITGYFSANGNNVLYAGLNNLGGNENGTEYSSIWRSENGGNTWTPLVDASLNVSDTIYGQSHEWWYRIDAFKQGGLGRKNSVVSAIDVALGIDPDVVSDDVVYVSGRGGIWKSQDGGDSWNPAVNNMQATANNDVAVNPNNPSQIAVANTDYVVLETSNSFEGSSLSRDKPTDAESRGYDVVFDSTADQVIIAVGDRDTNNDGGGEVYVKSSFELGGEIDAEWTNTNLAAITASNNGRVRAVSFGYHDGSTATTQAILAAVEGEGVFRYHNGTWTACNGVSIGATKRSKFLWPDNGNSGVVYLLDLSAGLYRSIDGGQNWTNMWPEMSLKNNDFYESGYLTADDNEPSTIFLSIQGDNGSPIGSDFRVFRINNADTAILDELGTPGIEDITSDTDMNTIERPGPIVLGPNGRLWLTQQQHAASGTRARLYVMENPSTDLVFNDVSTAAYSRRATRPNGIDVSIDNYVYISQSGTGLVKVKAVLSNTQVVGCAGDFNADGIVDIHDFLTFNSVFDSACTCPADMTGDGTVDINDFLVFNSVFGNSCD